MLYSPPILTPAIYTLSLHDALPICGRAACGCTRSQFGPKDSANSAIWATTPAAGEPSVRRRRSPGLHRDEVQVNADRKSTRLNSSHRCISYAVFCLKKKKKKLTRQV